MIITYFMLLGLLYQRFGHLVHHARYQKQKGTSLNKLHLTRNFRTKNAEKVRERGFFVRLLLVAGFLLEALLGTVRAVGLAGSCR